MYRIVIADDEGLECKALEKILLEYFPNVMVLPSVPNGIELISCIEREKPDIAIIDINMPGINGLEAMEMIRMKHSEMKILIVSAYSKFEYAQKALYLGATDYLLKPIKVRYFIETIRKLCEELDQEKRQHEEKKGMDNLKKEYRIALENELISDFILETADSVRCQKYLDSLNHTYYGGVILSIQHMRKNNSTDLSYQAFLEDFKRICNCFGKVYKNSFVLCLFSIAAGIDKNYKKWVTEMVDCVLERYKDKQDFMIGVSSWKYTIEELAVGRRESNIALYDREKPGIYFFSPEFKISKQGSYSKDLVNCIEALQEKRQIEAIDLLEQFFKKAEDQKESIPMLKVFGIELILRLLSIIEKKTEPLEWDYWKKIIAQNTYKELLNCLKQMIHTLFEPYTPQRYNKYIKKSTEYIFQHFMEDLSLDKVASQSGISSFYLSRLFKQELGSTFLEILTNIRIAKALEFLCTKNDTVEKISEKTGYLNVSYFYKVFKKQTGMTIGEIKNFLDHIDWTPEIGR